jgi:glycosyltransferase involved in cell wall biosynthesis
MGVRVVFTIYDLLCIQHPEFFFAGAKEDFTRWLEVVTENDGAICISQETANALTNWRSSYNSHKEPSFTIQWFHLGAEINQSLPTKGISSKADVLSRLKRHNTVLMVGTIEPRKGHDQVLQAFEILWKMGIITNLVIVGKQGWLVDDLCDKLRTHAEINHRLFWLEGISDEYLEKIYAASTCLVAASYGEGFGLPLIEAAQHGLPILARDIPVFREVAGEHAAYFKAETPNELAIAIKSWLADYQKNTHPKSSGMKFLTWKESAAMLFNKITQVK